MFLLRYFILIFVCFMLTACNRETVVVGQVQDIAGHTFDLAAYRGKWVIINYWASWCAPCTKEIPELNAFYNAHGEKQALILGVNFDGLPSVELQQLVTKMNINYPVLSQDPKALLGIDNIPGLPVSYIISPKGRVVKALYGEQSKASLEAATGLNS